MHCQSGQEPSAVKKVAMLFSGFFCSVFVSLPCIVIYIIKNFLLQIILTIIAQMH